AVTPEEIKLKSWRTAEGAENVEEDIKPSIDTVDSQIWHLLRSTGLTGRADRSDRSGLYSLSRIRDFVKIPHVILLVKGYVFPGLSIQKSHYFYLSNPSLFQP